MTGRAAKIILASATDAGNSEEFFVSNRLGAVIQSVPNLAGAEVAEVEISHDKGTTWVPYLDGASVELTANKNALKLYGPALYRVAKEATASATAIYMTDHQE